MQKENYFQTNKLKAEKAISYALSKGCTYAEVRFESNESESISIRNTELEDVSKDKSFGVSVRVIHSTTFGFSASSNTNDLSTLVDNAVNDAKLLSNSNIFPVNLSEEKAGNGEYISSYDIDPFTVPINEKCKYMLDVNKKLLGNKFVDYSDFYAYFVSEEKHFFSSVGSETNQKRISSEMSFTITHVDEKTGETTTLSSLTYPVGMGYEIKDFFNFEEMADKYPALLEEKSKAESIQEGTYDLVIDPTNLWLVIHESIGHATELDRILGFEANYAGTSFLNINDKGNFKYGSKAVNIIGDRTQLHGLATAAFDDEGVKTHDWDIIKDGILVDFQYNREFAARYGFQKSHACSYASSWENFPIQRMPNVSLLPGKDNTTTEDLIKDVKDGIYIVGDNSWSIDMQRYNFQFTGQLFYKIKDGKISGMYKDAAYQGNTQSFWSSCEKIGGKSTYILSGSMNCGKGEPGQVAPVSHGCPSALFRNVRVLNTKTDD